MDELKLKAFAKKENWKLISNQTYISYVESIRDKLDEANLNLSNAEPCNIQDLTKEVIRLEGNLQEAENTLAGVDGIPPKRIVRLLTADGCEVQLTGKDSLKYDWDL